MYLCTGIICDGDSWSCNRAIGSGNFAAVNWRCCSCWRGSIHRSICRSQCFEPSVICKPQWASHGLPLAPSNWQHYHLWYGPLQILLRLSRKGMFFLSPCSLSGDLCLCISMVTFSHLSCLERRPPYISDARATTLFSMASSRISTRRRYILFWQPPCLAKM